MAFRHQLHHTLRHYDNMLVILKSTGQVGNIPDDKYDPNIFALPQQQTQPAQPTQVDTAQAAQNPQIKSILQGNLGSNNLVSGNDIISNIINSVAKPAVNLAHAVPTTVNKINQDNANMPDAKGNPLQALLNTAQMTGNAAKETLGNPEIYKNDAALASYGAGFPAAKTGGNLLTKLLHSATSGAVVGGAQALPDAKNADSVVKSAALGAVLGGGMQAGGSTLGALKNVLGNSLQKGAESLSNKVNPEVFNKVVSASPSYTADIKELTSTAGKYGLMEGTSQQGLEKLPGVMQDIGSQIQSKLAQVKKPVDLTDAKDNILKTFDATSNHFKNSEEARNAKEYIAERLGFGTDQEASLVPKVTASDLYSLKQQVGNDLSQTFKKLANGNTNLMPKEEANLALWGGLKDVIDQVAPGVRSLNDDQHNLFDVAKGLVKDAQKGNRAPSTLSNIFATMAGNMVGGVPGAIVGEAALQATGNAAVRDKLGSILQAGGNGLQGNVPNATGALTKGSLASILGVSGVSSPGGDNANNNSGDNTQNPHNNSSYSNIISQNGGNSNTPSVNDYIDYIQGRQPGSTKTREEVAAQMANNPAIADRIANEYQTQIGSPEQQAEAQARYTSDRVVTDLENQYNQGNLAQGRVGGKMAEILSAAGFNPNLNVYDKAREAAASQIAQALADTGSKSNAKLTRAVSLLPTADSTPEEAKKSFAEIRDILGLLPRK
jgi:hypothetical protein